MAKLEYDSNVTQEDIRRAKSAFADEILRRALNYASYVDELNAELFKETAQQNLDTKKINDIKHDISIFNMSLSLCENLMRFLVEL